MAPRISVIMATYNHAPYVAQAIRSVLEQTFSDFEFLIVDDGSDDRTADIVRQFADPRIRFWEGRDNRGSAARRNELIEHSQGEFIAVQNSDDYWSLDKLGYQFEFLEQNRQYGAVFGRASYVDGSGAPLWPGVKSPFDQPNRPQGHWLRYFLMEGNCLCHPTVMLRRSCHDELGRYDSRLRQSVDWEMWIRLVKRYPLFVSDKILACIRWHGKNVSDATLNGVSARMHNERYLIASSFFDGVSSELLVDAFQDLLVIKNPPTKEHCDIEKALILVRSECDFSALYKLVGLRQLYSLLASPRHRSILAEDYGIDHVAFQRLLAEPETFVQAANAPAVADQKRRLEQAVSERDARIPPLVQAAAERDAMLASTSWRITAPLRLAGRLMRRHAWSRR